MDKNNFRIVAVKTLKGCDPNYLKILKPNQLYYFYNNIEIEDEKITPQDELPNNFYSANGVNINISAIVGKNGSGKSTIIEILFRIINNIAHKHSHNENSLKFTNDLKAELYFQADYFYKVTVDDTEINIFKYNRRGNLIHSPVKDYSLKEFFYTIAVNYSHYAYNASELGKEINWLDSLFHKNDGYQIPLVINPMRRNGNIEINNENHLVTARLITYLLTPNNKESFNFKKIAPKLNAVSLKLTLKKSKRNTPIYVHDGDKEVGNFYAGKEVTLDDISIDKNDLFKRLNTRYNFKYNRLDVNKYSLALDYILYKLISIAVKYADYNKYFDKSSMRFNEEKIDDYFSELISDESHVVYKLKQTLNFLRFEHIPFEKNKTYDLEELTVKLDSVLSKRPKINVQRIDVIPPPIFNVVINVQSDDNSKVFPLRNLSSGEKQLIYSVSSILYHLSNLNSISNRKNRISYKYINIVLEEIELYFHPEMQRKYIDHIVRSIENINLKRIKGINICFITHSPFVLSDIPKSNILFLDDKGCPAPQSEIPQTFGGNIIDLLSKSFFLDNGYIGEFSKKKIQEIIDILQENTKGNQVADKESLLNTINLVGEPFLKDKLIKMYNEKYDNDIYDKEKHIKKLEDELNELRK